jgi:hypothetical protein
MKKFQIIEEGRLNKSEMNQVMGGILVCTSHYVVTNCNNQLASCPQTYVSCSSNGSNNWSCSGTQAPYQGGPFGGGYAVKIDLSQPDSTENLIRIFDPIY